MIDGRNMEATSGVKQSKTPGLSKSRLISRVGLSQLPNRGVRRRGSCASSERERRVLGLEGFQHFTPACYLATWCALLPVGGGVRELRGGG